MSKLRLYGTTSGYKDLVVPAVSDNAEVNIGNQVSNNYVEGKFASNNYIDGTFVSNNFFQDNSSAVGSIYEFYTGVDTTMDSSSTNFVAKYNTLSYSEGTAGYNTSTGTWTAATAGIYMFNWVLIFQSSGGASAAGYINGYLLNSDVFKTMAYNNDTSHNEGSNAHKRFQGTAILKMAVNDTFKVFFNSYQTGSFVSTGSTLQILRMT